MRLEDNINVVTLGKYSVLFYQNSCCHHTNGPSLIAQDSRKQYHKHGQWHNLKGKALIGYGHKGMSAYRIDGKNISKEDWENATRG